MQPETKQILYSPVDIDDAEFSDFNREPSEDEIEFQKFKDEFKQSNEYAKVSVYRQPTTSDGRPGQKSLTFLFEAGVEEYTFSQLAGRLRDQYGTGTYRVQLRDKSNLLKMNRAVHIEAPKIDSNDNSAGNIIEIVSRTMQEQQMRTERLLREVSGPRTGGDAFEQITKMMAAMGTMMGAMGVTPQQAAAPKTLVEQLTEFKMIKELFGGDSDDTPGGDANLYTLLGETVKAFGGPIAAAIAAGSQSGALNADGIAINPALPAPTDAEKVTDKENHNVAMRKNIHILIQNAKTKIPAEAFAQILVTNTPEDKQDELWDFISSEKCVDTIIELEPAAEAFREWFDALRIAVIDLMAEPDKGLQDESGASNVAASPDDPVEAVAGEIKDSPNDAHTGDSNTTSDP